MNTQNRVIAMGFTILTTFVLMVTAGCRSASTTTGAAPVDGKSAATKQQAMDDVKNNPNIPEQTKANILRQMQGGSPTAPVPAGK